MDTPDPKPRKGLAIGSAAIGAAAILGSLLAFSGGAGAQDAPELTEPAAAEVTNASALVGDAEIIDLSDDMLEIDPEFDAAFAAYDECFGNELGIDLDSEDPAVWDSVTEETLVAADEACGDLLPEGLFDGTEVIDMDDEFYLEMDEDFAAYDECVQNELGIDFESADDAAWETITDDVWTAADAACEDQLPQEIRDMNAAWDNYDTCLAENGIDFSDEILAIDEAGDFGAAVYVEDGEDFTMAEFGDADGVITITQADGEIVVAAEGDVELLDGDVFDVEIDEEWEAAHAACEGELPEDAFFGEALLAEDDLALFDMSDDILEVPADA